MYCQAKIFGWFAPDWTRSASRSGGEPALEGLRDGFGLFERREVRGVFDEGELRVGDVGVKKLMRFGSGAVIVAAAEDERGAMDAFEMIERLMDGEERAHLTNASGGADGARHVEEGLLERGVVDAAGLYVERKGELEVGIEAARFDGGDGEVERFGDGRKNTAVSGAEEGETFDTFARVKRDVESDMAAEGESGEREGLRRLKQDGVGHFGEGRLARDVRDDDFVLRGERGNLRAPEFFVAEKARDEHESLHEKAIVECAPGKRNRERRGFTGTRHFYGNGTNKALTKPPSPKTREYLAYHRETQFKK